MTDLIKNDEYRDWIVSIKSRFQASQTNAVTVNVAMLELYWFLGEQIIERQETSKWGDGFWEQMSRDLLQLKQGGYDPIFKHSRWSLLKRPENRTAKQTATLRVLLKYNLRMMRAYLTKKDFSSLVVSQPELGPQVPRCLVDASHA